MSMLWKNDRGTFFGETLMRHLKQRTNTEIWPILHNIDPCPLSTSLGNTLLHFAAKYGNKELTQHLIKLGAAVDIRNLFDETPLMFAVEANQEETTQLLLEAGADIFVPNFNGRCALGKATSNKYTNEKIRTALLDKVTIDSLHNNREHVNSKKFHADCPLYHFMSLKNAEITRIFLESGSPVDAKKRKTGETALFYAARDLDLENVQILLKFNANVNAKTRDGRTPLASVPLQNQSEALAIVKLLIAAGAKLIDRSSRVIFADSLLQNGNREIVRAVLQSQLDLQFVGQNGMTPLHYLSMNEHPGVLDELSDYDFDVNARYIHNRTMLHLAVLLGNASSVKFLVDRGADINIEDSFCNTPLSYAFGRLSGYSDFIDIAFEGEADLRFSYKKKGWFGWMRAECNSDDLLNVITPILADVAWTDACGREIIPCMRHMIDTCQPLKNTFDSSKSQIEEMKKIKIGDSVTLFDFLNAEDVEISRFARNKRLVANLNDVVSEYSTTSFYYRRLDKRFVKWNKLVERRASLVTVISQYFNELFNIVVEDIAEKIVDYLCDHDLCKISFNKSL